MDFALTVTTISLLVCIVLQLITLIVVARNSSSLKRLTARREQNQSQNQSQNQAQRPERMERDRERERRDPRRDNRRPPQGNQTQPAPQQAPTAQPGSPVDKSLREINLRLKNAERDQERARQRLQGEGPRGEDPRGEGPRGDDQSRDRDRDRDRDRGNRRGGSRRRRGRGPRDDGGGNGFRPRDGAPPQSEPRQYRNDRPSPPPVAPASDREAVREQPAPEKAEAAPVSAPAFERPKPEPVAPIAQAAPAASERGVGDAAVDHGRKFAVKRRSLGADGDGDDGSGQPDQQATHEQTQPREITFGRR